MMRRIFRVKILALLQQEREGLLMQGQDQIEFLPLVFIPDKIIEADSILLTGVMIQIHEFKIQIVDINSVCEE